MPPKPRLVRARKVIKAFNPAVAEEICQRIAAGERLNAICADPRLPDIPTVSAWVLDDTDGFAARYERARMIQALIWTDEILDIADRGDGDWKETARGMVADSEHIQRAKLRVDARKWLLSKFLPKQFGETMGLTNDDSGPVKVTIVQYGDSLDPSAE